MEETDFRQVQRAVGQGAGAPVTRQRDKNMRFGIFFASFWILNIYFFTTYIYWLFFCSFKLLFVYLFQFPYISSF